jgi:hypothetical protein
MAADDPQPPIEIHSVMINEAAVEISYAEEDDANRNTGIMKIRTIMIPRALVLEEMVLTRLRSSGWAGPSSDRGAGCSLACGSPGCRVRTSRAPSPSLSTGTT